MSLAALKNNRANTQKLIDEINKMGGGSKKRTEDDRFWKPTVDKVGNGYAVIRFLPTKTEEELVVPFVTTWDHGFQGPSGRWYIENSLTTIGKDDPVSEFNSKLWNSGAESDKEQARKQKRRLHYIANIFVVKDPGNPANEGKVFLFKFGSKIHTKIKDAMSPPEGFEDETPIIPYDFWEGANFKLKIRRVEGFPNYDSSSFEAPSPLFEDDERLEEVYNSLNLLKPFVSADGKDSDGNPYFKPYEDLKDKLYSVLDLKDSFAASKPDLEEKAAPVSKAERFEEKEEPKSRSAEDDNLPWGEKVEEEESELDYFRRLAEED